MIPYLLAAIGGYLIGQSTESKMLNNAANGSVADAGLEVASASVLEKGGLVEMLPAKELIRILKSIDFKSFNADDIKKVEYETETYNPFDKDFEGRIYLYPAIIDIDKNKEGGYLIRIGKNNGWVGGLAFKDAEYSFNIKSLNVNELEKGLKKAVKENIVTLYSMYNSGSVEGLYFTGTEKDAEKFAKSKGYKKIPIEVEGKKNYSNSGFAYFYHNEKMSKWSDKNILYPHRFSEDVVKRFGIKEL